MLIHIAFQISLPTTNFLWSWEPTLTLPLFAFGALIAVGIARLGKRTGYTGRWRRQFVLVSLGWLSLIVALNSPLHALGESLFWVHMIQHELLLLVSAPLFVLGQVFPTIGAAFSPRVNRRFAALLRRSGIRAALQFFSRPLPAWCLGAVALWIWHVPSLFDATLRSDWIHAAQHLTFLATSFCFWFALFESRAQCAAYGVSILYLFATTVETSFLGVLLTYSARAWYSPYVLTAPRLGYTPLEDQQIGGLIMWIPAGVVLTGIALSMIPRWLRSSDSRQSQWAGGAMNAGPQVGRR